ncbi:unnamed protein product, partial [Rotaria magnacalcarata]
ISLQPLIVVLYARLGITTAPISYQEVSTRTTPEQIPITTTTVTTSKPQTTTTKTIVIKNDPTIDEEPILLKNEPITIKFPE